MSRMSGGETIVVKPTNNVYTVLVAIAVVIEIAGMVALVMAARELFKSAAGPGSLF